MYRLVQLSILLAASLACTVPAFAQDGPPERGEATEQQSSQPLITGTVTDSASGEPLPGVNVAVASSPRGTSTDINGSYEINVPATADTLILSYIGYQTERVAIEGRSRIDVQLATTMLMSEGLVVIGYGSMPKSDLTGAVSSVEAEDIAESPAFRVDQMLQGRAAGAHVVSASGEPGAATTIRIRGANSIGASNEPLYVVDGIIGATGLNGLNPNDIASIEVLKDATATSIYGARGANGVILITTKRGQTGEDRVRFSIDRGWQTHPREIDMLNAAQYAELINDYQRSIGAEPLFEDPSSLGEGTNWQDEVMDTAPLTDVQLSFSGGDDDLQYYLSGNYFDRRGIVMNSGVRRYQFRLNLDKSINDRFSVGNSVRLSQVEKENNTIGFWGYAESVLGAPPTIPIRSADGSYGSDHPHSYVSWDINNPVAQGTLPTNNRSTTQVIGNVYAEYDLTNSLSFKSTLGIDGAHSRRNSYMPGSLPNQQFTGDLGEASVLTRQGYTLLNENTFNFAEELASGHSVDAVAGFTYQTAHSENLEGRASRFVNDITGFYDMKAGAPDTRYVDTDYSSWSIGSVLGRANYTLQDKYLATIAGRYDGSSRLSADNRFAFFPSGALAWRASKEPFIKRLGLFSTLKPRVSFGYTGNQAIGPYGTLPALSATTVILGGGEALAYTPSRLSNDDLKWETTRQLDLGVEAGFFDDRLQVELDYYRKRTDDLLLNVEIPRQTGYSSRLDNVGSVKNHGIELTLRSVNIAGGAFEWESSLNVASNANTVVDLGDKERIVTHRYNYQSYPTGILREGEPIGTFYGAIYEGTWKSQEEIEREGTMPGAEPGSPRYRDVNGDGAFDTSDFTVIGNASPLFYGGLGNTFSYKGVELSVFLQGSYGNDIMDGSAGFYMTSDPLSNQYALMADRWTPENSDSNIPKVGSRDYVPSTRWVHDGSHLRLKTLRIGYSLPADWVGVTGLHDGQVYMTGSNLWIWDSYETGYDPEVSAYGTDSVQRGYDYTEYPRARSVTVGFDLGF